MPEQRSGETECRRDRARLVVERMMRALAEEVNNRPGRRPTGLERCVDIVEGALTDESRRAQSS
jgi:hypothetical protein